MKTVVCFGDSNTWGFSIGTGPAQAAERLEPGARWPRVMAAALPGVEVIEEGLPGRTTVFDDPVEGAHKNAMRTLIAVLETHAPIDLVILMLGTNDFKSQFNATAFTSSRGMLTLIQALKGYYVLIEKPPEVLVVTPAQLSEAAEPALWGDAARRSEGHDYYLAQVAERSGCFHFDANRVARVADDGVHIDANGHRLLGAALASEARRILDMRR